MSHSSHSLPSLPYGYDALEPYVDKETMFIHHTGHHQTYVNKLNEALKDQSKNILQLHESMNTQSVPVRNNSGGHYNHSLFWKLMAPIGSSNTKPFGALQSAIDAKFGSFESMKEKFTEAATTRFGSGWAWLGVSSDGSLVITSTPNQGVAETELIPILGLDVWEHAYYLKYQNKRPQYIQQWWNIVNWDYVVECYENYASKGKPVPIL